jgi:hypothetical protein
LSTSAADAAKTTLLSVSESLMPQGVEHMLIEKILQLIAL